jgi:hypothetical protein
MLNLASTICQVSAFKKNKPEWPIENEAPSNLAALSSSISPLRSPVTFLRVCPLKVLAL